MHEAPSIKDWADWEEITKTCNYFCENLLIGAGVRFGDFPKSFVFFEESPTMVLAGRICFKAYRLWFLHAPRLGSSGCILPK